MAIYEKLQRSLKERDFPAYVDLLHDDAVFVFHKSGCRFNKKEWSVNAESALSSVKFVQESSRCLYESDELLITHAFMKYPDGTREAVLAFLLKKDEKIIHMETGSTQL